MTDCCVSPPSIGTWKIYVRTPIYFPNRIKWNWNDGTGENIIEGDDYTVEENNIIPDGTSVSVKVIYKTRGTITESPPITRTLLLTTPIGNLFIVAVSNNRQTLKLSYGINLANSVTIGNSLGTFSDYSIVSIIRLDGQNDKTHTLTIKK